MKPPHAQFKDATVPDMLKLLGMTAGVDIRYQVAGDDKTVTVTVQ